MKHQMYLALAAALFALNMCPAGAHAQTPPPPPPPFANIGEVKVEDARVVDLSGRYLARLNERTSVSLDIIQDQRGKLAGTLGLNHSNGERLGPFPAAGSLILDNQRLRFEFRAGSPTSPTLQQPHILARGLLKPPFGFQTEVIVKNPTSIRTTSMSLVPRNPKRGILVRDAQNYIPQPGNLVSTRTVLLPWGERRAHTHERNSTTSGTEFILEGLNPPSIAFPPPLNMKMHGAVREGAFRVHRNELRLGYGALDETSLTAVRKSATAPVPLPR